MFTTRPDTAFGMTFCVLAQEHPLVEELIKDSETEVEARDYIAAARRQSEIERMAEGDKTGVFTGRHAINPVNDSTNGCSGASTQNVMPNAVSGRVVNTSNEPPPST